MSSSGPSVMGGVVIPNELLRKDVPSGQYQRVIDRYPLIKKHGIKLNISTQLPIGCEQESLKSAMIRLGKWDHFCEQSNGWTMTENGAYPWDVEGFLQGEPNLD